MIKAISKAETTTDVKQKCNLRNDRSLSIQASKWWFIISGEEAVLKQLSKWLECSVNADKLVPQLVHSYAEPAN